MKDDIEPRCLKTGARDFFCYKASAINYGTIYFNNAPIIRENIQKHLGLFLDSKFNFFGHTNEKIKKATKELVTTTFLSGDNM